jgi:hypothetical protein
MDVSCIQRLAHRDVSRRAAGSDRSAQRQRSCLIRATSLVLSCTSRERQSRQGGRLTTLRLRLWERGLREGELSVRSPHLPLQAAGGDRFHRRQAPRGPPADDCFARRDGARAHGRVGDDAFVEPAERCVMAMPRGCSSARVPPGDSSYRLSPVETSLADVAALSYCAVCCDSIRISTYGRGESVSRFAQALAWNSQSA